MRSNFSTDSSIATKPHLFHKPCTQASSVNILLPSRGNVQDASHDPTGWSAAAWISAAGLWENSRSWHRCVKDAWRRDTIFFAYCSKDRIQIQTVNVFGFWILILSNQTVALPTEPIVAHGCQWHTKRKISHVQTNTGKRPLCSLLALMTSS